LSEGKSGIAHQTTRSRFDSIMSSAEKIELKADPAWMKILGFSKLDTPPESISFDNWSPDPWTITGSGGGAIMTFSQIGVTVLKAQMSSGEVITRYLFAANIQSDGWQGSRNPGASIIEGETFVQIGFKNAQGGSATARGCAANPNGRLQSPLEAIVALRWAALGSVYSTRF
jgi:hypothetical protein